MFISKSGKSTETIVARIRPGYQLFEAINKLIEKHEVKAGYIPMIHGCFDECKLLTVDKNKETPGDPLDIEIKLKEPVVFTGSGTIAFKDNGEPFVHIHLSVAKKDGTTITGHLMDAKILLVTEIVIEKLEGIEMGRKIDPQVHDIELLDVK